MNIWTNHAPNAGYYCAKGKGSIRCLMSVYLLYSIHRTSQITFPATVDPEVL